MQLYNSQCSLASAVSQTPGWSGYISMSESYCSSHHSVSPLSTVFIRRPPPLPPFAAELLEQRTKCWPSCASLHPNTCTDCPWQVTNSARRLRLLSQTPTVPPLPTPPHPGVTSSDRRKSHIGIRIHRKQPATFGRLHSHPREGHLYRWPPLTPAPPPRLPGQGRAPARITHCHRTWQRLGCKPDHWAHNCPQSASQNSRTHARTRLPG